MPQVRSFYLHRTDEGPVHEKHKHRQPQFSCVAKAKDTCKYNRLSYHIISYHIVELKRHNRLKVQAKSKDAVSIRRRCSEKTSWKATLWAGGKRFILFRLERCYIFRQGVQGLWASNWDSTATNGWSLDRWHQKTIGACRTKPPPMCIIS